MFRLSEVGRTLLMCRKLECLVELLVTAT